jgi:alkylation response protein AidB-like acyl-CoA dehydrogenase
MDYFSAARALAPMVDELRGAFDQDRSLPLSLVDAMGKAGLFGLWQPRALGGPELAPVSLLKVTEELARQDASVGWCAVIPAGYSRLAGAMVEEAARTVFGTGRGVLVGSLNPSGKAIAVTGGYRVTGRWSYGSFIEYSDWVLGNCLTVGDAGPLQAADGGPAFRLCLFPRKVVEVFDIWHVGGLRATGSNDYAVTDLFVPEPLSIPFPGFNPPPVQPGPLYNIPLPSTFVSCIAAVMLGIARSAIEALVQIAGSKTAAGATGPVLRDKPMTQVDLARAEAILRSGRAFLFDELRTMWDDVQAGRPISIESRAQVRLAAVHAGQCAIQATDLMYQLAGGAALFQGSRLERCLRDIHAAGQHIVMSPQAYLEPIGRVFLGLPPDTTRF